MGSATCRRPRQCAGDRGARADALAQLGCLNQAQRCQRLALLRQAVDVLKAAGAVVYIDAGNARWISAPRMAARLKEAGIDRADGFALNVSSFLATSVTRRYGVQIARRLGGKHFIIDTSRNGRGGRADRQWCNPSGQALGQRPTTRTGHRLVGAYLWIKPPGESDGRCNRGPRGGVWWAEHALGLARRQHDAALLNGR